MPAPYDYSSTLGGATGIAPAVQSAVLGGQAIQQGNQTLAANALQLETAQRQEQRQQAMQSDFATLAEHPTAAGYAHFMTLYPEAHDALGKAWDALNKEQRDATLKTVSDVYARLQNGDADGAVAQLQAHMDAGQAAGEDTSDYPALIEAIKQDPKKAAALAGYALASTVGADKFGEMFKALNPSDRQTEVQKEYDWRTAQFGKQAADTWLATQDTKLVPVQAGGQVYAYGGSSTAPETGPQPKGGDRSASVMGYQTVANPDRSQWDKRADGSAKGMGWLGLLRRPDGGVSSEISVGVNIGGKEREIPLMVPGLSKPELDYLMTHDPASSDFQKNMPRTILSKAVAFARQRLSNGKDPFRQDGEPAAYNTSAPTGATVTPTGPAIEHAALAAVPGAVVTSGMRSAEHNRAVGGVSNSYHLTDQARDLIPPKGMPMAMFHAKLKKAMPGFDVLNEGTHVHIEPGPGLSAHAGPIKVTTPQQAEGLAPGTHYITPDGQEYIR